MSCNPEALKHVPLFALLDDEETAVLAGQVELKKFAPRQRIYKMGDAKPPRLRSRRQSALRSTATISQCCCSVSPWRAWICSPYWANSFTPRNNWYACVPAAIQMR